MQARAQQQMIAKRSPVRGTWNVEELTMAGQPHHPILGARARCRRVVFDFPGSFAVQLMSDARQRFILKLDESKRKMSLARRDAPTKEFAFAYSVPAADVMTLDGQLDGKRVQARLRRVQAPSFLLTTRGFHWINEVPFNR